MMVDTASSPTDEPDTLQGKRVALLGRFASMARRDLTRLLRDRGAMVSDKPHSGVDLIAVGSQGLPLLDETELEDDLDSETFHLIRRGRIELVDETQLCRRLGLVDADAPVERLYTPAMLAELLGVSVAVVRRWCRRGLIVPAREVRHLPYFDFREVATAKRLAELLATGISPRAIERKLEKLRGLLPGVERPLAQLSVIIEGSQILLRQGDGLIEPGGQMRFDFESVEMPPSEPIHDISDETVSVAPDEEPSIACSPERLATLAAELEEAGRLVEAADTYRAAMAAGGPTAERCFLLAELLYRLGQPEAACERYYIAIELDENYVEARANLGCVLAESGQMELAVAALEGALAYHPDYPDAHYQLARLLDRLARPGEAEQHWRAFVHLAPDSPWADQARTRLEKTN